MSAIQPLRLDQTVEVARVSHRLALGVQWIDALSRQPAGGPFLSELEALGSRPLRQHFERHPQTRHALRRAGRLASLLVIADAEKSAAPPPTPADDPTNFVLRGYAVRDTRSGPTPPAYAADADPRQYVPRRLALTPVLDDGMPVPTAANIRRAWLWPGAAYPVAANTTSIRGHVRQGPTLDDALSVPWTRIVVTRPVNPLASADFATEPQLGWGHGDERGEFLVVLGVEAVPGGAVLPQTMTLRVWVFLPPAPALDPADVLASLPLEQAGSDPINDVLRGIEPPAGYLRQTPIDVNLAPGEASVMNDAVLRFP